VTRTWLHRKSCKNLILFCNGWGMDDRPFLPLTAIKYDVCMFCNYSQLQVDEKITQNFDEYDHVILIGWSMGVWAGQKLFADISERFSRTIAINGTLCPISDRFGIPEKIFDSTLSGFAEKARTRFYRRMCRDKTNLELFLVNQPQRTLESQQVELKVLRENVDCVSSEKSIYNEIIVADNDRIIPSLNQYRFWGDRRIFNIRGFHFLFYLWQSWDQLLTFSDFSSPE
jgi:biotin synthesis protein BioG